MLRPGLPLNPISNQARRRVIGPDAIRGSETHAGTPAIGAPAAGLDLALIKGASDCAILIQSELHRLRVRRVRLGAEIDDPGAIQTRRILRRCTRASAQSQRASQNQSTHAAHPFKIELHTAANRAAITSPRNGLGSATKPKQPRNARRLRRRDHSEGMSHVTPSIRLDHAPDRDCAAFRHCSSNTRIGSRMDWAQRGAVRLVREDPFVSRPDV